MLTSAYFEKMFTPRWREGQELGANGLMILDVPDTDPSTFLIILNVIHCRGSRAPRSVDFNTLTELAVLTDYFQCHEALERYPSLWLEGLKDDLPSTYCDNLMKWICVSWVFNHTETAQRMAPGNMSLLDLPIPKSVYGEWHNQYSLHVTHLLL